MDWEVVSVAPEVSAQLPRLERSLIDPWEDRWASLRGGEGQWPRPPGSSGGWGGDRGRCLSGGTGGSIVPV
jgi:hypothetical protein